MKLAAITAAGTSCAGVVMYTWGASGGDGARHIMLMILAIGLDLIARTDWEVQGAWPVSMLAGALSGVPYKLYAVASGDNSIAVVPFVMASFIARLVRFSLAVGLVAILAERLDRSGWSRAKAPLLGWAGPCSLWSTLATAQRYRCFKRRFAAPFCESKRLSRANGTSKAPISWAFRASPSLVFAGNAVKWGTFLIRRGYTHG